MRLSRWEPQTPLWNHVRQLQGEVNRLFERWGDGGSLFRALTAVYPPVNVWEDAESVFVEAELPSIDPKALEIHVTGGDQLTLKGERQQIVPEKGVLHRQERGFGSFVRVLTLPSGVDADKVDARFENGVLLITMAKREAAKPRKITVKGDK
jgi:HSP20 family protein